MGSQRFAASLGVNTLSLLICVIMQVFAAAERLSNCAVPKAPKRVFFSDWFLNPDTPKPPR
jgi:hypothetical protein